MKKRIIWGIIVLIIIIILLVIFIPSHQKGKYHVKKLPISYYYHQKVDNYIIVGKEKYGVLNKKYELVEAQVYDSISVWGDYYITVLDNNYQLRSDGKYIKALTFQEDYQLIKTDKEYIPVFFSGYNYYIPNDLVNINKTEKAFSYIGKSIIYNNKTGVQRTEKIKYQKLYKSFVLVTKNNKYKIINTNNQEESQYYDMVKYQEPINSHYFVVYNQNKQCLLDKQLKEVVGCNYDAISLKSNNQDFIAAKRNGLWGLINKNNKIILDFKYDGIEVYNNYIVVSRNKKLDVLDLKLKSIITPIPLIDTDYYEKTCCGNFNYFIVSEKSNFLGIKYFEYKMSYYNQTPDQYVLIRNNEIISTDSQDFYQKMYLNDLFANNTFYYQINDNKIRIYNKKLYQMGLPLKGNKIYKTFNNDFAIKAGNETKYYQIIGGE